jgi:hypothetical protein
MVVRTGERVWMKTKKQNKIYVLSAKRDKTGDAGHVLLSSAYLCTSHGA